MKRFGLRAKFILLVLLLFSLIFIGIALILVHQNTNNVLTDIENGSKQFAALSTKPIGDTFLTYHDSGQVRILEQVQRFSALDPNIVNIAIVDVGGVTQFNQNSKLIRLDPALASSFTPMYSYDANGIIQRIVSPLIEDTGAHRFSVVYTISSDNAQARIRQTVISIFAFSAIGLLLSAVISYLLISKLFLKPIRQVSKQALLISSGNLSQQIRLASRDEVGDLARALNQMTDALKADIQKLKELDVLKSEFMMISSHNLLTPLTVITGYTEILQAMELEANAAKAVEAVSANTTRLQVFAEDMLIISELEAGTSKIIDKALIPMASFFIPIIAQAQVLAIAKNIKIISDIPSELPTILAQKHRLSNAIWNILDNALKFTPKDGEIRLNVDVTSNSLDIIISDTGIGIASQEMPKLFTKFHRGTSTLVYDYEGTGIGLYLAKLIIEQNDGTISISSQESHGTKVTISLPLPSAVTPTVQ